MTHSDQTNTVTAERVTIRGTVRWAFTDRGRIIVQFADDRDALMALAMWDQGVELISRRIEDGSQLELQLLNMPEAER